MCGEQPRSDVPTRERPKLPIEILTFAGLAALFALLVKGGIEDREELAFLGLWGTFTYRHNGSGGNIDSFEYQAIVGTRSSVPTVVTLTVEDRTRPRVEMR